MGLPVGYKLLEYIESSGTQYINTGFRPNQNTRVTMELSTSNSGSYTLFGTDAGWTSNGFAIGVSFGHYGSNTTSFSGLNDGAKHSIDFNKNSIYIDNALKSTFSSATFQMDTDMVGFANNRSGAIQELTTMKLYSFKIYDNSTIVRDFIPCKNSSGEVGLWDDINRKFYSNAGSGNFIAGAVIDFGGIFVKVNGVWKQINNVTVNVR